jgi:hypothetical protein
MVRRRDPVVAVGVYLDSGYLLLRDIVASVALTFFAFLGFGVITAKDLRERAW